MGNCPKPKQNYKFPITSKQPLRFTDYAKRIMSTTYQLKIKGHLDQKYSTWFGGLKFIHTAEGDTLLTCTIPDQAALHGILGRCRDLGLTLISVNTLIDEQPGFFFSEP